MMADAAGASSPRQVPRHVVRYFREDPAVEKFRPSNPLLRRAIKDISDSGSTFEGLEAGFGRLLEDRDAAGKYVLSNDLWSWIFHNLDTLDEAVQRCLLRVKHDSEGADGALTVDLHGMRRWTAASVVVFMICCEMSEEPGSSLTFITGIGKHSIGTPVLYFNMVHLFRELQCPYETPHDGCFKVTLNADFRDLWESVFSSSRLSDIQGGSRRPQTLGVPSNVADEHWNPAKQDGVDRVKGRRRDKTKQALRDLHRVD